MHFYATFIELISQKLCIVNDDYYIVFTELRIIYIYLFV